MSLPVVRKQRSEDAAPFLRVLPAATLKVKLTLQAEGAYTKAGTWAPTETDAEVIEMMADKDEEWEASLAGKDEWINRPAQPPGLLRSGAQSSTRELTIPAH
jgi:hypothetical protein